MERIIKVEDKKIYKILKEKGVLLDQARAEYKEIEKKQQAQNRLGNKIQKIKDKALPMIKGLNLEIGTYEDIVEVDIGDEGVLAIKVVDQVEMFKKNYTDRKNKEFLESKKKK